jgi:hypothetical protein
MGKSSPTPPAAPDPTATAAAQTKSNIDTANATANLNHTNQVTPWGNLSYSKSDQANPDGTYNWTATTQLSPEQQKLLQSSNGISQSMADLGQQQIGNVANTINKPLDFNSLQSVKNDGLTNSAGGGGIQGQVDMSKVPGLVGGDALGGAMKDAQNASYSQQLSRLDPQFGNQQHDLENQLTQQGIMRNTEAWNRATDEFGRNKNDAYQTAYNNSVNNGNAAQAQLFNQGLAVNQNAYGQALNNGMFANSAQQQGFGQNLANAQLNNQTAGQNFSQSLQGRNQGINELLTQQQNPLNVLNALRTGSQVTSPTFGQTPQGNVAGTNTAQIDQNAYQNQMGLYNSQVGSNNNTTNGLFSLGAAALMSDVRLKENIKRVGFMDNGLPIYTYTYKGSNVPQMGVMAQEVEQVIPQAVSIHASGFKQVHYGML